MGLAGGFYWTPVEVVRILQHLGVTADQLPPDTPANIFSLMSANNGAGTQRWWFFKKGYQVFWKTLKAHAGIRVKLNEPVLSMDLTYPGGATEWVLTTDKKSYQSDKVIVATTPRAAMHFVPESP